MATEAQSKKNRTRLVSHFDDFKGRDKQSAGWSSLWESNESDLWDRGRPSPALISLLDEHDFGRELLGKARSMKAFVPGCGRGHDVAMLALHGFESYGLEVSQHAVETANKNVQSQLSDSSSNNFRSSTARPRAASAQVIVGDFFQRDWEGQFGAKFHGFDLIYDYTFLCALLPEMRKDWARRMADLLSPSGLLICLEFPMWKPLKAQGPPWGLNGVYSNLLRDGADGLVDESGQLTASREDQGIFERILYWSPPQSFEQGREEDMISIWKLKTQSENAK